MLHRNVFVLINRTPQLVKQIFPTTCRDLPALGPGLIISLTILFQNSPLSRSLQYITSLQHRSLKEFQHVRVIPGIATVHGSVTFGARSIDLLKNRYIDHRLSSLPFPKSSLIVQGQPSFDESLLHFKDIDAWSMPSTPLTSSCHGCEPRRPHCGCK